jgi:hypothetical protein
MMTNKYRVQVRRDEGGYLWARLFKGGVQIGEEYGDHGLGYEEGDDYFADFTFRDETIPIGSWGAYIYVSIKDQDYDGCEIDCHINLLKEENGDYYSAMLPDAFECVFVA